MRMATKDSLEMSDGELQKEFTEGENGKYLSSLFNFYQETGF